MLAIVIPYYKYDFFEETLKSLSNQTDKRFHLYIGDDASINPPDDLLKKYEGQLSYTYKRFDSNLGSKSLVKQWERCLAMVKNETWIQILGDDDVFSETVVASFYKHLDKINNEGISVIRYGSQVINQNGELISNIYQHPVLEKATGFLMRKFKAGTRSSLSEYVFTKDSINTFGFKDFPLAWSSDVLAVIEFSNSNNIYTINDSLVYFRLSEKNITGKPDSVEKNEAKFMFFYYLLLTYGKNYQPKLINVLLNQIEKVQLNNKKTPLRWLKLFYIYLKFNKYSRFLFLLGKVENSIK